MPEVGYQEVYLPRALSRLGHDVLVVTSDRVSPSSSSVLGGRYEPGLTSDASHGFSILRLKAAVALGAMVLAPGVKTATEEFAPEIVIVVGVGKLFPNSLLTRKKRYGLVVLFGDNSDWWDFSSVGLTLRSLRSKISQRALKDLIYRRAVKYADSVCLYTPDTKRIVSSALSPSLRRSLERKQFVTSLGFDPDEFYFSADERKRGRDELGAAENDCVLVTCTRVTAKKNLERVIDCVSKLCADAYDVRYVIAGFLGDGYESRLKSYIARQPRPEIFHCYPFLDHHRMRQIYCSADVGIWLKHAISIYESMGTGLPLLLELKPSVSHLVEHGVNGWQFLESELATAMEGAVGEFRFRPRDDIADENTGRFSYDVIARDLIASVSGD